MRVAVVHSFYSSSVPSGENRVVEDQVRALRGAGHSVQLVARRTDVLEHRLTHRVEASWSAATGRGPSPTADLHRFKPDVVHVHNLFPNFGTEWISESPAPVVVSVHNYRFVCANGTLFRDGAQCTECVDRGRWRGVAHGCYRNSRLATIPVALGLRRRGAATLEQAALVLATSPFSQALLERYAGLGETLIVPNFGSGPIGVPRRTQERMGWVALGRMSVEKGFVPLVEQWPADRLLTIIGSGPEADEIDRVSMGKSVTRLDAVPIDELRRQLPWFRGLIVPSLWFEVAPQVVVEAMRLGVPIIAHESNCVAETVRASGAGATYRDSQTLISALERVDGSLDEMSLRAVQHYNSEWTEARWLSRIESAYASALRKHR